MPVLNPSATPRPRLILSQYEVRAVLERELGEPGWLAPRHSPLLPGQEGHLLFGDSRYYIPSREHVLGLMEDPVVDVKGRREWQADIYDCDEFAFMLRAHVVNRAYYLTENNRRAEKRAYFQGWRRPDPDPAPDIEGESLRPYAFGIIWATGRDTATGPSPIGTTEHAFNWVLVRKESVAGEAVGADGVQLLFIEPHRIAPTSEAVPPCREWFKTAGEIQFAPRSIRLLLC
jgi:hypothetical protein